MSVRAAAALLLLAVLALPGVTASGADYTAASSSPVNSFAAAASFNTVAVALTDPGTPLQATVALHATASSERGITSVAFQSAPTGTSTWTTGCTDTTAPYDCDWDSTAVTSGDTDLRAVATDAAGYTQTSVVTHRIVNNTGPTVTLTDPGVLTGTKTISATATDVGVVTNVTIAYRVAGTVSWTTLCSGASRTPSCSLDTTTLTNGADYELHATATDDAGHSRGTAPITRKVDNTPPAASTTPPAGMYLRGYASMGVTASDPGGSGIASVRVELSAHNANQWMTACNATSPPYDCGGDTSVLPDGSYDARAVVTDNGGLTTTTAATNRIIDNHAPTSVTLTAPATLLQGSVALSGTATDATAGVDTWRVESTPTGGSSWSTACSSSSGTACTWDTTGVSDRVYDLRVVATDRAGNATTTTRLTGFMVDNRGPAVAVGALGTPLRATVPLSATATDQQGVTSVTFERSPAGANTWTTICSTTTGPAYTCNWDTTGGSDGFYDVRARATDTLGHISVSTAVTARQIDNTAPAPVDVQAANGSGVAGRPDTGDTLTLTWSEAVDPASVLSGWNGSSQPITVQVTEAGTADTVRLLNLAGSADLAIAGTATDIALAADRVSATTSFDAHMVRSGSTIVVTIDGQRAGGAVKTGAAAAMTWKASTSTTDVAGNPATATQVTETGALDNDF